MTPEVKVEVAFGFGPYDPEPLAMDWVDITSDVMEIHTVRGRQAEFENFTAGTCSIILYDENRTYDPLNTAVGSWGLYGVLKANTPIRITAEIDSTTYPVWRGYTDEWRTEFVVVDSVDTADAPPRVDATCVTSAGTSSVTKLS